MTKPEAEDVIVEMKKKTTVRKLEEAEMQMKKLMKKKKEVEKMKMKTGNLCEVKLVDESIIPEGRSQKNMSKLTPKLFSIFEHQKPKIEILERGILESCDIGEVLPLYNSDNTRCAQDCKAGTRLGGKQPIEGLDRIGKGDCTDCCEQNGELGLASRERKQGHLTNKRGLQRKTGVEISREKFEILGAEQQKCPNV